jgi:hypothetical protein
MPYFTPTPGLTFVAFWSDEAEALFRKQAPAGYLFAYQGGSGMVVESETGTLVSRSEFEARQ